MTKDDTTIIEGAGTHEAVTGRINLIRHQIEETDSSYDKENFGWRSSRAASRSSTWARRRRRS